MTIGEPGPGQRQRQQGRGRGPRRNGQGRRDDNDEEEGTATMHRTIQAPHPTAASCCSRGGLQVVDDKQGPNGNQDDGPSTRATASDCSHRGKWVLMDDLFFCFNIVVLPLAFV